MDTEDDLRFDRGDETPERLKGQFSRLVGMTAAQTRRVAGDALRSVGAHKDHFVVLAALAELGPASQSTLSDRTRVYRSDLVTVLNELTDGGWVRRSPDPADKRRNVVSITTAGQRRLDELDAILREVNDRVLAPLSADDRARLFRLLEQVNAHLVAEADVS
ncbi:MarR family winged helix-turn-helix transcriptional regulator [Cellulosimicrobium protaetiae]|uniref:MarR family transcriptional regulator n=1 Tax=Cellulosimicrobium protaetiae TaxID=2587808 RepID=A0A6M5U8T4_9MICO|nr:MarR family transcriptional regulator [Cellulosimicrobium protaetiae]QJW34926.1 MarR family transcriptional regulator [Cellulosimicrobium protaetiae]